MTLAADAAAVITVLRRLEPGDFGRPTPCPAWDVAHLAAHLHRDFERIPEGLAHVTDDPADTDAVSYWRYDRSENQVRTQVRAEAIVAASPSPQALVDALARLVDAAVRAVAEVGAPGPRVRLPWGPVMAFDDLVGTRWVECVVHSLDLTDALGLAPVVTDAGIDYVCGVLDALAGGGIAPVRTRLHWSGVEYIRAATGRRALTPAEADALGPELAAAFPLLA